MKSQTWMKRHSARPAINYGHQIPNPGPESCTRAWYKTHVPTHDPRNFEVNSACCEQLETVVDSACLSSPYSTPGEATMVKSFQIGEKIGLVALAEVIGDTLKKRPGEKNEEESLQWRLQGPAHDVAPILGKALGLKEKDLMRGKEFVEFVENWRLGLREVGRWKRIQKKKVAPKGHGERKVSEVGFEGLIVAI